MTTQTLDKQFAAFEQYLKAEDRSANTINGYLRDVRLFARWFEQTNGELLTPKRLTKTDAQQYRQFLLTVEKQAPATINRKLAALRAYVEWAREAGHLEYNPINRVKGVKEQETAPHWLSKRDQGKLVREVEAARNAARTEAAKRQAVRDHALLILLLHTGLRIGEVCDLTLNDIQRPASRKGKRKQEKTWKPGELLSVLETARSLVVVVRSGKGAKRREPPLNAEVRKALKEWLAVRTDWLEALEVETDALFMGKKGQPLRPRGVQRRLAEYGRRAGVEVTPHILRHTCAKRLLEAGASEFEVAAILGHRSLDTTLRYGRPGTQDLQRAVDRLAD